MSCKAGGIAETILVRRGRTAAESALARQLAARGQAEGLPFVDDDLDAHECMLPLVLLLERAAELTPEGSALAPPRWLELVLDALRHNDSPK